MGIGRVIVSRNLLAEVLHLESDIVDVYMTAKDEREGTFTIHILNERIPKVLDGEELPKVKVMFSKEIIRTQFQVIKEEE